MDKETLDKVNALTRREFKSDEIYTFPVTLCGNDIDRDCERFSDAALDRMAELFIGKTIIRDHDTKAANQTARIYDAEVVTDETMQTKYGAPYKYLKGYAYMVRTESNADMITLIDGGILKEVSVGCSVASRTCSICGHDLNESSCSHKRGAVYDGQLCHSVLDGVNDAYELSFTPVPAQPEAGVTKQYKGGCTMSEFKPITTQADFDAAVQPLIDAAVSAKAAEFEGYISPDEHQQALDALTASHKSEMLKSYREKAAVMSGLPAELAERLTGDTEEDIWKDAETLAAFTRKGCGTPSFTSQYESGLSGVEKHFYEKNPDLAPKTGKE